MRRRERYLAALLVFCAGGAVAQQSLPPVVGPGGSPAPAMRPTTVEGRLARVERLLDSGALVEMATRLEQLQSELQKLRGDVELHGRDLEVIKQRQRDLYLDIDRRLRRAEVGNAAPQVAPSAPPPAAVTPPPAGAVATTPSSATPTAPASPPPAGASATVPPPASPAVQATPALPPAAPVPAAPPVDRAQQQLAYQAAFDLLKEGRYPESITAFEQFLASYPAGAYSDNAQYWLGEARYVTRDFTAASRDFQLVIKQFPGSPKVPDAMLKLGYAQYELKDYATSRATLTELRQKYPSSTAARLAASRLERMAQEGR
ncbi:MAG: tol-pal system protein YbgF [Gammaproteobacteria bacterium]|nr:tol-pal system protein YbgF [Gammaproteobacteria bacterium]